MSNVIQQTGSSKRYSVYLYDYISNYTSCSRICDIKQYRFSKCVHLTQLPSTSASCCVGLLIVPIRHYTSEVRFDTSGVLTVRHDASLSAFDASQRTAIQMAQLCFITRRQTSPSVTIFHHPSPCVCLWPGASRCVDASGRVGAYCDGAQCDAAH